MVHSSDWPGRSTALCGGFYWLIYFVIILAHLQATSYAQHEYVAYCYRWSSMVCLSVSLCVLVTTVSPAKMDEPIKMPFWCGLVGWRNHLLDGGPDPSREGALDGAYWIIPIYTCLVVDILKVTHRGAGWQHTVIWCDHHHCCGHLFVLCLYESFSKKNILYWVFALMNMVTTY